MIQNDLLSLVLADDVGMLRYALFLAVSGIDVLIDDPGADGIDVVFIFIAVVFEFNVIDRLALFVFKLDVEVP